jgi:hypothetical protein
MLNIPSSTKIFLCTESVDMRKSFDALAGMVETHFGKNPLSGHLFCFFSKRRDRMKILAWDVDGFILYYKRLEQGTFAWIADAKTLPGSEILASDFALLLAGINPSTARRQKRYRRLPEADLPLSHQSQHTSQMVS